MNKLQLCIFPGKIPKNSFAPLTDYVLQELFLFTFSEGLCLKEKTLQDLLELVLKTQQEKILGEKLKYSSVHP